MKKKVFVGMSGGVDSSVAAWLLKKQGYDVTGVFMRCFNLDGCAEKDAEDARRVASYLKIPFYVFDFEEEYKKTVVDYMVDGYQRGLTPNPDVMCNKEIKFGLFLKKALALGADYVATGHYIRLRRNKEFLISNFESISNDRVKKLKKYNIKSKLKIQNSELSLCAAKDLNKDQSYFLWTLNQNQLKHCLFPVGDYLKPQIRVMAKKAGLPTAVKKDSQGICFLGNIPMADFLKTRLPVKSGKVIDPEGRTIGEHDGVFFYTIGQRHGLKLSQKQQAAGLKGTGSIEPYYIAAKKKKGNVILAVPGKNNPLLSIKEIDLDNLNLIRPLGIFPKSGLAILARVRYRQPLAKGKIFKGAGNKIRIVFEKPQKFVAAGQSAVFYSPIGRLEMLGGGVII